MKRIIAIVAGLWISEAAHAQYMDFGATAVNVAVTGDTIPSGRGSVALSSADVNGANNGTTDLVPRFMPGKSYSVNVSAAGSAEYSAVQITVSAPPGYYVLMNGIPTSVTPYNVDPYSGLNTTCTVTVLPVEDSKPLTAGSCTTPLPGKIFWEMGLGPLPNGQTAGKLGLISDGGGDWSQFRHMNSLVPIVPVNSGYNEGFPANATTAQLTYPACLVQLDDDPSGTFFTAKFYNWSQTTYLGYNQFPHYSVAGQTPFMTYKVEQVGADTHLKITSTATTPTGSRALVSEIQKDGSGNWTVIGWHDPVKAVVATTTCTVTTSGTQTTQDIVLTGNGTIDHLTKIYRNYAWGLELVSETHVSPQGPLTTSYDYYTDEFPNGNYSYNYMQLKSVTYPSGTWEAWDYSNNGLITHHYKPWLDDPAAVSLHDGVGVVTNYAYQTDGPTGRVRPSGEDTFSSGSTISSWSADHQPGSTLNGQPTVVTTRNDRPSIGGTPLVSTNTFYSEDAFWFYTSLPAATTHPDGSQESYGYETGSWNPSLNAFTASGDPTSAFGTSVRSAVRTSIIHGCQGTPSGSTQVNTVDSGLNIVSLAVFSGLSTKDVSIRDEMGNIVRTETWVWNNSSWTLLTWSNLSYDIANQLVSRTDSTGATYSASWQGDFKVSETNPTGNTTTFLPDEAWRVYSALSTAVGMKAADGTPISARLTQYAYDAANRKTSEIVGAGSLETLTSSWQYDTAGRLSTETHPGTGSIGYSYPNNGADLTTTYPTGGVKYETHFLDGRPRNVTGAASVPKYFSYDVQGDGSLHTLTTYGSTTSSRATESWTDMLGRIVKTKQPGFGGQTSSVEIDSYGAGSSLLASKSIQDGNGNALMAPTLFQYNAMGQLVRSGLHSDAGGTLSLMGNDRVTDTDTHYAQFNDQNDTEWWRVSITTIYPTANSASGLVVQTVRDRLTGFGAGGVQADNIAMDPDGNVTRTTTVVGGGQVTSQTTTVGSTNTRSVTTVNGLGTQAVGFNGLTSSTRYDSLWRPVSQIDTRQNVVTTHYTFGTTLPASLSCVTDANSSSAVFQQYTYDGTGRLATSIDGRGHTTRFAYDALGNVLNQWGDASYPVSYTYDVYGTRVTMQTYRDGNSSSWNNANWPSSPGTADTTSWSYDSASGLLSSKTDSSSHSVGFTYTLLGKPLTRTNARGLVATYSYDPNTADPISITYSDSTPSVTYTYSRAGLVATVQDATAGSASDVDRFSYNPSQPTQLKSLTLPAFYGSLVYTPQYNTDGLRLGRPSGFLLGSAVGSSSVLSHTYTYENTLRLSQITASAQGQSTRVFAYHYRSDSDLLNYVLSGTGGYQVNYGYETTRDVLTQIQSGWGTPSSSNLPQVQFNYGYDLARMRLYRQQSGGAFNDFVAGTSYSSLSTFFSYDAQNQVNTAVTYRDAPPSGGQAPASSSELPGRRYEYRYDEFGNRTVAGPADPNNPNLAANDDTYTLNSAGLNQYGSKQNSTLRILGNTVVGASVSVPGAAVSQLDRNFGASLVPSNGSGPAHGTVTISATLGSATASVSRNYVVPSDGQSFTYDADGNLTADGMWNYYYDAENRLKEMDSTLPANAGFTRLQLKFKYDYLGRRVEKQVYNLDSNPTQATLDRKFLYQGWSLVAETDASGNLLRSYTWGLDVSGSLTASGGVGSLLEERIVSGSSQTGYYTAFDGNGNLTALINAGGSSSTPMLAAVYEYGPFGEALRAEVIDSAVQDSAVRFSSKYLDIESGLSYYGNRYYSAATGRFINRDPIEEAGGLNLYGFAGNDSVNGWDVLGNGPNDSYGPPIIMPPSGVRATGPTPAELALQPWELQQSVAYANTLLFEGSWALHTNSEFLTYADPSQVAQTIAVIVGTTQLQQNQKLGQKVKITVKKILLITGHFPTRESARQYVQWLAKTGQIDPAATQKAAPNNAGSNSVISLSVGTSATLGLNLGPTQLGYAHGEANLGVSVNWRTLLTDPLNSVVFSYQALSVATSNGGGVTAMWGVGISGGLNNELPTTMVQNSMSGSPTLGQWETINHSELDLGFVDAGSIDSTRGAFSYGRGINDGLGFSVGGFANQPGRSATWSVSLGDIYNGIVTSSGLPLPLVLPPHP